MGDVEATLVDLGAVGFSLIIFDDPQISGTWYPDAWAVMTSWRSQFLGTRAARPLREPEHRPKDIDRSEME